MGLGVAGLHHDTTRYHFIITTGCVTARAMQPGCQHGSPQKNNAKHCRRSGRRRRPGRKTASRRGTRSCRCYPTFKGIKRQRPEETGYRARRRRYICQPPQAIPAGHITYVDGSGTATGLARRKPVLTTTPGARPETEALLEDDKLNGMSAQHPPRSPRDEPELPLPSRSFH